MFQLNIYKLFNNDLKKLNNNQLQIHWRTTGKKEKRISHISHFFDKYPDFKINLYKEKYPEIKTYDDIIIMSHYHHNTSKDFYTSYDSSNNFDNYINTYLLNYYKFDYNYSIILFDYSNNININDLKFDKNTYIFTNKNYDIKNKNLYVYKINFDIYLIHDLLLNINSDYYLFIKDLNVKPNNLIDKNPNIIYHEKYKFIKKNILKFYNFYTLINDNIQNFKINNKIIINENINYTNYKFYDLNKLITNKNYNHTNNIFINIDINNYNDLFYIIKIISYFENKNFNIYLKENNYLFFKNYFIYDDNLDLKIIDNVNDINKDDNFIINDKIDINFDKFNKFNKINNNMINEIFKKKNNNYLFG